MPRFNQILQSKFDFTEEDIESSRRQAAQKNESYASYLLRKNLLTEDQLLAKVNTARMISPTGRSVDIPIENGYVGMVDRKDFDPFLRKRAADAGAARSSSVTGAASASPSVSCCSRSRPLPS